MDIEKQNRLNALLAKYQEIKKYEQLNNNAVDDKWRSILCTEKNQQQKDSIQKIRADYTKQLDRCDSVINRLIQWLNDGESQYQFALRAHKRNLELLTALSNKRLDNELDRFNAQLKIVTDEYNTHRKKSLDIYNSHIAEYKDITNAIEHEYSAQKADMDSKFRTEKESLQMKNQEAISALRAHILEETTRVITEIQRRNEKFKEDSDGRMMQFQQMYEKHKKRQKVMKANEEEILKKAAEISHWRRKIKNNARESKEANDRLRTEKENLSQHFRQLKDTMAQFRTNEARKLAEISVAFEDAINNLTEKLKLAERILKYAEMTRKLETEKEQVLPFTKSLCETDPEFVRQMQQFKSQLKGDSKYVAESDMFDKFYRRFNKVLLDKLSLQREREALLQTNNRLKSMLKKYMSGMAVSKDLMNKPNTLFIVNQNTNAPLRKVDQEAIPKIDAQMTLYENNLQLGKL